MRISEFESEILEIYGFYWRTQSALAILKSQKVSPALLDLRIEYSIPHFGLSSNVLNSETLRMALLALGQYESRIQNDIFLSLVTKLEQFLSHLACIASVPNYHKKPLGPLQEAVESEYGLAPCMELELIDEVRLRRNAMMHHVARVTQEYLNAVMLNHLVSKSSGRIADPTHLTRVDANPSYIAYVVDLMIRYARLYAHKSSRSSGAVVT